MEKILGLVLVGLLLLGLGMVGVGLLTSDTAGCEGPSLDLFGATERKELDYKIAREGTLTAQFNALIEKYRADAEMNRFLGLAMLLIAASVMMFPYFATIGLALLVGTMMFLAMSTRQPLRQYNERPEPVAMTIIPRGRNHGE